MATNLTDLADTLKNSAGTITARIASDNTLAFEDKQSLSAQASALIKKSKDLYAQAVIQIGDDVTASINKLTTADKDITNAIKTITNVTKVISIATTLVSVASNLLTGNYAGVINNVQTVITAIG